MSGQDKKLKCPNCGQEDKGFFEFVGVTHVLNNGDAARRSNDHPLFACKGLLCLGEGCASFRPESNFVVDPVTQDCVGSMPGDPF